MARGARREGHARAGLSEDADMGLIGRALKPPRVRRAPSSGAAQQRS